MLPAELTTDPPASFGAGSVPDLGAEGAVLLICFFEVMSLPAVVFGYDSFEPTPMTYTLKVHLFDLIGGGLAYGKAEFTCIEIESSELARRNVAGLRSERFGENDLRQLGQRPMKLAANYLSTACGEVYRDDLFVPGSPAISNF